MINRDIASTLFVSPKTVEANLARVYRKLNIHSRAELGAAMTTLAAPGQRRGSQASRPSSAGGLRRDVG
jgi:hypothetical protein